MNKELNRRTGRTTRIANYAVEQLHSVGTVIVTDHTAYDNPESNITHSLKYLVGLIKERIDFQIDYEILGIDHVIYLKLTKTNKQ